MANHPNRSIKTVASCFRAGKEHTKAWTGRASDERVLKWLKEIDGAVAHVLVRDGAQEIAPRRTVRNPGDRSF